MSTSLETTVTTEAEIKPELRAHLSALLSTYKELKFDLDAIQHQMDIEKLAIWGCLKEAGVEKAKIDGFSLSVVKGNTSKLDKLKFVELGGSLQQLENATFSKPKKAYLDIDLPGAAKKPWADEAAATSE